VPSDSEILAKINAVFGACRRPWHFTNYTHCDECAEHDELLLSRDRYSLRIEDVGNPAWDLIYFVSVQGFVYYLPALARLALEEPAERCEWYGGQLCSHLIYNGPRNERFLACTPKQRRAIADFLRHLVETRSSLADYWGCADDLVRALEIWSEV